MPCVKCQAELDTDARFCWSCGSAVDEGQRPDRKELLRQAREAIERNRDPKKAEEIYRNIITDYPSSEEAELARACLYNINASEARASDRNDSKDAPRYISTYKTARLLANLVSFIGWVLVIGGSIGAYENILDLPGGKLTGNDYMTLLLLGASLFVTVWGVLLVTFGQFVRATFDTADFSGEMLVLMKSRMK
ncbi:MAG: hypothetical protein ACREA0_01055 [bacterium]